MPTPGAIWAGFTALLTTVGEVLGIVRKKQELNNTPEMQKADEIKKQVKQNDGINTAIENRDDDAIRRSLND